MIKGERLELSLPWPPSINHYYRHTRAGRHYIAKEGKDFRKAVAELLLTEQQSFGESRLSVAIVAHPPDNRARDLDNIQKALLDSLQHAGLFNDDKQIDFLAIKRGLPSRQQGGSVSVVVEVL